MEFRYFISKFYFSFAVDLANKAIRRERKERKRRKRRNCVTYRHFEMTGLSAILAIQLYISVSGQIMREAIQF